MSVYDISLGNNRKDTAPKSVQWEWSELVARLNNVLRCEHTSEQYETMSKAQRVDAKDCGYFIGGICKERRQVVVRNILSLDIDDADATTLDDLRTWLTGYTYVIHSTHSSTPEEPRYRVVAPLSRVVQADEYDAVMRILSEKMKIPLDLATLDFNRIMFLPSVPADADYFFETGDGEPINVDTLLSSYPDWRDLSKIEVKNVKVQDPDKKGGWIGAFCAKVTIREAIETYCADKWRREPNGTYTYIGASTTCGGRIFENKYLVSFHSTDPYRSRSHHAYDVVRLYKYGDDGKIGHAKMQALCETLDIKPEDSKIHNRTLAAMEDEEARQNLQSRFEYDKNGNLVKSLRNSEAILTFDPDLAGVFGYDLFSDMPVLKRIPYWRKNVDIRTPNEDCKNIQTYEGMEDVDESYLRLHFEDRYAFDARAVLTDALNITTHKNSFHPVRDYLNGLTWDGEKRLERIFIDCFGVPDTLYSREVGMKFFVGAVRRVFIPASKMDYIPVLVSEEGLGKSKFIRRMAKLWGSDTFYTFNGGKEAYEQLRGVWLMEIAELNGVQNRSTNSRKAFVTKGEDRYRSAYLKYTKTYKRQCVFIATSNDVVFLDDPSEDGRRWWGLLCNPSAVKVNVHEESFLTLVDLYWAEAAHYYRQNVLPVLSPAAEAEARMLRQVHKTESIEEGALIDYLNMPVPKDWYDRSVIARRHYWEHERELWGGKQRDVVCTTEVAREFFKLERGDCNPMQSRRIGDAIRATKLFTQDGSKKRFGEYGQALAWVRTKSLVQVVNENEKPKKRKNDT